MRPLIAVAAYDLAPGRVSRWPEAAVAVPAPYVEAVQRAHGQEAILSPRSVSDTEASELLARFDGLLLLGGSDLDSVHYGQARHPEVYGISETRDAFELALARAAVERGTPTLAVCRGLQVLNVARGGTLDQHITDREGLLAHGVPNTEDGSTLHEVTLERGSRLAAAMGVARAMCSSHHHQAVDRLGEGLVVTARSDDGVIEGAELAGDAWIVAVQWHPEDTAGRDAAQQRLFDTFVARVTH